MIYDYLCFIVFKFCENYILLMFIFSLLLLLILFPTWLKFKCNVWYLFQAFWWILLHDFHLVLLVRVYLFTDQNSHFNCSICQVPGPHFDPRRQCLQAELWDPGRYWPHGRHCRDWYWTILWSSLTEECTICL